MAEDQTDVVKWYTRARRFPQLIGRTPDGAKLWGGPYTVTQAVGAGLVLIVGLNTMGLWAQFGTLGNAFALIVVVWSTVWLLGRIPVGSRSPLSVLSGLAHAFSAPRVGRLAGRPVRLRHPHRLRHTIVVALSAPPEPAEVPEAPGATDGPQTPSEPVLTGIQGRLAQPQITE